MTKSELIVAPATPPGKGAVGIVRLSGAGAARIGSAIVGGQLQPRQATLRGFRDATGNLIDRGIALYFPQGHSYTGEEMLELQGHGGPVVQQLLISRCLELGARLATPGEFTLRAFLNDRLDLSQAEAVADLIDAQSELAARGAMRSLEGEFSREVRRCVEQVVELRALVESSMDFPEEGLDLVPDSVLRVRLHALVDELGTLLRVTRRGRRLRDGATLTLVGAPNVGKSSLLNRLTMADVAIVSDIPGTTRDTLREQIVVDGLAFELLDTAGLRETMDPLELMGMERTRRAIGEADLVVLVEDHRQERVILPEIGARPLLRVVNKIDVSHETARIENVAGQQVVYLSAKTGEGMELLRRAMAEAVGWTPTGEGVIIARERHLIALQDAHGALLRADEQLVARELFAEELRLAQLALSCVVGEFTSDDLLGEIFSKFCIGK